MEDFIYDDEEPFIEDGVQVDFVFKGEGPSFGDLFQICGYDHPKFPASGRFDFNDLSEFGFEQVDDYFGIPSNDDDGDDTIVWLYPIVNGHAVYHHEGPFSAVRLSFSILRNNVNKSELFLNVVEQFSQKLPVEVKYSSGGELDSTFEISVLRTDINRIVELWRAEGIEPGSNEALEYDI